MSSTADSGVRPAALSAVSDANWLLAKPWALAGRRAWLLLGDLLATAAAVAASLWLWSFTAGADRVRDFVGSHPGWLIAMIVIWLLLGINLYSPAPASAWLTTTRQHLARAGLALCLYLVVFFLAPRDMLPRLLVVYFVATALPLGIAWRWLYLRLAVSPYFQRRTLVLGAGWSGEVIASMLAQMQPLEYRVLGFVDDDPAKHSQSIANLPVLGGSAALLPAVKARKISDVILAVIGELDGATFQTLLECQRQGVRVVRMSSLYEQVTGRVLIEHLDAEQMAAAFIEQADRGWLFQAAKRLGDVAAAVAGLLWMGILLPLIAAAICLESRGPIFYRQTRMGQHGRLFTLWKFRTMVPDAEADGSPRWADPNDKRVTRVGRWLRRYRLDEVPQFINVLQGDLSLIGPRPERPEFVAELEQEIPFYSARHLVKPGMTGWAQVNYGYSATVAGAAVKLQWDLYYIKHRSAWLDIVILLRTIGVVLSGQGT
jgi:exopolysaccharide biosynthesis polyprenyl glycosylphosphotransferase